MEAWKMPIFTWKTKWRITGFHMNCNCLVYSDFYDFCLVGTFIL